MRLRNIYALQNGDPAWIKTEEGEWFQCTTGGIARVKVPPDRYRYLGLCIMYT